MGSTDKVEHRSIILFDGVCNFCSGIVRFVINRDTHSRFLFCAFQSQKGEEILIQYRYKSRDLDSVLLIQEGHLFTKSTATLLIAKKLNYPWPLFYGLIIIPAGVRDYLYEYLAKRRYQWFGKMDKCMMPDPQLKSRFLE